MKTLLLSVAALVLMASSVSAEPDASVVPGRGEIVPAFGLHELTVRPADDPTVHELDALCGMRPGQTSAVLVLFVDANGADDLAQAQAWYKKFHKAGLEIVAISIERQPDAFASTVEKARYRFPVLDDRQTVVSTRYGVSAAPFSFLLNDECRVLGMSNRSLAEDSSSLESAIAAQTSGQLGQSRVR